MRYLIFGGTGSLGKKLIHRLLPGSAVAVYSRDEAKQWTIKNELANDVNVSKLDFFVGDIRDKQRIKDVLRQYRPHIIIIAAALKQVDTCELSPDESILTNVTGTQNVVSAINELNSNDLQTVLFVSTDKACSPINVYGMCKALSERIVTSQVKTGLRHVNYLAVRYGNVLESRGSIIPLFKYQAENSEHLTVTDPTMTRFVMTLDDSVDLIMTAVNKGSSGQTWIPRLPAMKIGDLADIFAKQYNKPVKNIGLRPGEKMHEDLINDAESVRTFLDVEKNYYVIGPSFLPGNLTDENKYTFSSADSVMTKDELFEHLTKLNIIDKKIDDFPGLAIEEIATNRK
jgi:UDP-glucose 4-epimerase